jgi:hypothetical protein
MAIKTVVLLVGLALASVHLAEAQQPKKVPRIGYLSFGGVRNSVRVEPFRQGLRQLGYAADKGGAAQISTPCECWRRSLRAMCHC